MNSSFILWYSNVQHLNFHNIQTGTSTYCFLAMLSTREEQVRLSLLQFFYYIALRLIWSL
jgi:hypothetical protein